MYGGAVSWLQLCFLGHQPHTSLLYYNLASASTHPWCHHPFPDPLGQGLGKAGSSSRGASSARPSLLPARRSVADLRGDECAADSALEKQKRSPLRPPRPSAKPGSNLHPLDLSLWLRLTDHPSTTLPRLQLLDL